MDGICDEGEPLGVTILFAARADERLVSKALGDNDMRQRVDERDVGTGPKLEVEIRADVR